MMMKPSLLVAGVLAIVTAPSVATADRVGARGETTVPGELDPSFGGGGWVVKEVAAPNRVEQVLIQADWKIVVAGSYGRQFGIWRFLPNGDLDGSFGGDGEVTVPFDGLGEGGGLAAALQPDGKIVVVGYRGKSMIAARLLPDGNLDPAFGAGGKTKIPFARRRVEGHDIELLPDGRILLGGLLLGVRENRWGFLWHTGTGLALLTAQGTLDASFGSGGMVRSSILFGDLSVAGDKVVVVGKERKRPSRFLVARYGLDGALDPTLGGDGLLRRSLGRKTEIFEVTEVDVDAGSRIVLTIAGEIASQKCFLSFGAVVRLNPDGAWDTTFSGDGVARSCANAEALLLQDDGRILVGGEVFAGAGSGEYYAVVRRLLPDGAPDATFGEEGTVVSTPDFYFWSSGRDVVVQQDGKIVLLAGAIYENSFGLARFLAA